MNGACNRTFFFAQPPGALERGKKVKYHSITKSISKIFKPNFVCLLTNEDIKHLRRDFHSVTCVMPQGWDLGVLWGVGVKCNGTVFLVPAPWGFGRGVKVKYH